MPRMLIAFLLLLIPLDLGILAMNDLKVDHFTIRYPGDSAFKSSNANKPNPNLPNLSDHGKELEEKFARDLHQNPGIQNRIGGERVASSWWEHIHAESSRDIHHTMMNMYADDIKELKDRKKSTSGKQTFLLKKEKKLHKKHEEAKQERDKHREKMRDIRKDAYIHKEAGNFTDKDVHYVTQMFHDDSASLGYLSDGRHISSPRNPELSKSRSANFSSEPSSSPKLARSRSGKA